MIERLIKEIRVIPIKHQQRVAESNNRRQESNKAPADDLAFHTIWSYYYGLGEYERSANDTPLLN